MRRGFDAFTLLLSGVSANADSKVVDLFSEVVLTPPIRSAELSTQEYGITAPFVERVRNETRPVGINVYLRSNVAVETGISSVAAAMTGAFFGLLGTDVGKPA